MKKLINKIKNLSLEKINKSLIFIALLSLIYRNGSFALSFPNPFEIIFILLCFLTFIDIVKNKKIKEFFLSIPKKIWIAISCLVFSVLLGWLNAIFLKGILPNFNTVLEFGGFIIGLGIFFIILFYTNNDEVNVKKYFYALLIPVLYVIFILFSNTAGYFNLVNDGTFLGLTSNPNIISKILLIPIIFFVINSLFEFKNKWLKMGYIIISSALVALLFWTNARAAIFSFIFGIIFVWIIFSLHNFNWKKFLYNGVIIFVIILMGFTLTPHSRKNVLMNRIKNVNISSETRIQFWPVYLKKVTKNPMGFGPNTHMSIPYKNGEYLGIGPHNTYIEIWLWGGLLGLFSFLFLLFFAFKNLKEKLQSGFNPIVVSLIGILLVLSISIIFNDSLQLFWFWIILALSIGYEHNTKN